MEPVTAALGVSYNTFRASVERIVEAYREMEG
jgi:hypothetical protein